VRVRNARFCNTCTSRAPIQHHQKIRNRFTYGTVSLQKVRTLAQEGCPSFAVSFAYISSENRAFPAQEDDRSQAGKTDTFLQSSCHLSSVHLSSVIYMMNVAIALLSIVLCWLSHTEAQTEDAKTHMPRAILHIGPHKTASSSVQELLTSAEGIASMRGQNTYWPDRNGAILAQHEVIKFSEDLHTYKAEGELDRDSVVSMWGFFNESLSLGHNVILSTENFVKLQLDKIRQLKDMLQGFNVTVSPIKSRYTPSGTNG
jgi:hypothetical protein